MSLIKASSDHLVLSSDGSTKEVQFQIDGVEKASISSAGAFTSTTIDATALTGALPAIDGSSLTGVGGNLKIVTAPTHSSSYTNSSDSWTTTGSGWTITTGADTNRIAINLTYYAMTYDSNGGAPGGYASIWTHSSMSSGETPSGTELISGIDWFGGYNYDGSSSRHDLYWNNTLCGIATVSPSTTYYIQLVTKRVSYGDYIASRRPRGYIMEYSQ